MQKGDGRCSLSRVGRKEQRMKRRQTPTKPQFQSPQKCKWKNIRNKNIFIPSFYQAHSSMAYWTDQKNCIAPRKNLGVLE